MKFQPLSTILKKEIPVSITVFNLKPVEGISHICPDCNQLLFSDKLSRELHKYSCNNNHRE